MSDERRTAPDAPDMDKAVDFSYPEGMKEVAAMLDFLESDEERLAFVKALSRTLQ